MIFRSLGAVLAAIGGVLIAQGGGVAGEGISDNVVKIGVLTDMSGPFSDNVGPGAVLAAAMAVEDFGGTVNGAKIEVVVADHQNRPDIGATIVNRWYDTERVDMVTEVVSSAVAMAVQEISHNKNRVFLATGPGTPDLTGKACSPVGVHWAYDNYALGNVVAGAAIRRGLKEWFFLTVDYSFGHTLEESARRVIEANNGKVLDKVRHPMNSADMSSFLLQAQASGAQVIGIANAGADMINAVKQAREFGLLAGGQSLVPLLVNLPDIASLGLENAQGLILADSFYWDTDEETRAFSTRFMERFNGRAPGSLQVAVYGAVTHYLKAIEVNGSDEAISTVAKMREIPINDFYTKNAMIREDGRVMRDMYLFRVKKPEESFYDWDFYELLEKVPAEQAFRPRAEGGCPLPKG
jgi:branched-chain amino acid transport system substrate-binding protein